MLTWLASSSPSLETSSFSCHGLDCLGVALFTHVSTATWREGRVNGLSGVELRTLGGIESMTAGWMEKGGIRSTTWTSKFESCVGTVTVWGDGDTPQTTVLDKCAPPTVHCLLALNNILRPHLENIWVGDLWTFLQEEVKVVPHSYQGKEGAFEGPQCNRIL